MANYHLIALLKKNWRLRTRSKYGGFLEILLPFICIGAFGYLRQHLENEFAPKKTYFNKKDIGITLSSTINTKKVDENDHPVLAPFYQCREIERNGSIIKQYIALIPSSDKFIDSVEAILNKLHGYQTKGWESTEKLFSYIQSPNYTEDVCFAIEFRQAVQNKYSINIFFNNTDPPSRDIIETTNSTNYENKTEFMDPFFKLWKTQGFLILQNYIDNLILQQETRNPKASIQAIVYPIESEEMIKSLSIDLLNENVGVFTVLPMILCFLRLTQDILNEKEKKIREGMKIMGMRNLSFYSSWVITYFIIFTIISILVALGLKIIIFKKSNYFFLFIWFWLFSVSLIFQSLFISSLFTRAKLGTIIAIIFFFFNYLLHMVFTNTSPENFKVAASFSTQTGIALSCKAIIALEENSDGISFLNIQEIVNNFSLKNQMLMMGLNIAIFAFFSIYLDQVFPNQFGRKKKPLFFLSCLFSKKQSESSCFIREKRRQQEDCEDGQTNPNVEQVSQLFKEQEERNEVLKISNLKKVFHGRGDPLIAVNKLNLTMYKDQIFVLLGHNGAGKTTTLSMLTGFLQITEGWAEVNGYDIETEMESIRQFLGVCPQHDILFDALTVREHLELFASFKGMTDPELTKAEVERFIDDVDLREKADVQSKNLSGGQKRRLSVAIAFIGGSKIIFLDQPTSGMDTSARRYVWDMLKKYKNNRIVILTTHFMDEADYLGDRIGIMENGKLICCGSSEFLKDKFGVGYNLTIGKQDNNVNTEQILQFVKSEIPSANVLSNVSSELSIHLKSDQIVKFPSIFNGLDSQKDNLKIESYGISITTLEEVFLRVAEIDHNDKNPKINQANEVEDKDESEVDNFDLNAVRIKNKFHLFAIHLLALIKKKILYFKRDNRSLLCEIFIPLVIVAGGFALSLIQVGNKNPQIEIKPLKYDTPLNITFSGAASQSDISQVVNQLYFEGSSKPEWDEQNIKLKNLDCQSSCYFNRIDNDLKIYDYQVKTQTISKNIHNLLINQINTAIIRNASGKSDLDIQLTLDHLPLPLSVTEINDSISGIMTAFVLSTALSMIPSSLISFTVKERIQKIKHQQIVNGVSLNSYWMSNYVVDFFKYLVPAISCIFMLFAFSIEPFTSGDNFQAISILFISYGWNILPFTYLGGLFFQNTSIAQIWAFFFNFLLGAIAPLLIMSLRLIKTSNDFALIIQWILRIFPSFCFGYGVVNIANQQLYATVIDSQKQLGAFDKDIAGGDIVMLAIFGVVDYLLIFFVEYFYKKRSLCNIVRGNQVKYSINEESYDSEVKKEMDLIAASNPQDYAVRVEEIRKVVFDQGNNPKIAIDKISFGLKEGDCFGLLGVNGAGKTTIFKMLTGEIKSNQSTESPSNKGTIHIKGFDLSNQMEQVSSYIGHCPQFDALLENLTAREHLEMYASIKGIPEIFRKDLIAKKIKEMGLTEIENQCVGKYSGGNKRKLSVTIAMLGNPPILFLDEPSRGMDPEACRFMWKVISSISKKKKSSVIFTTHSMEEAEALCTRLAIMANGTLKCLGTLTQIKNKFGQGYEVVVKTEIPKLNSIDEMNEFLDEINKGKYNSLISEEGQDKEMYENFKKGNGITAEQLTEFFCIKRDGERLQQFIKEQIGSVSVIEHFSNFFRFKIDNTSISIGKVFEFFEENKKELNIAFYNVRQATIEQIFNSFAKLGNGKLDKKDENLKSQALNKNVDEQSTNLKETTIGNLRETLVSQQNGSQLINLQNEV